MKKKKKKGSRQQDNGIDFGTKMNTPLAISAILFFGVVITLLVQMNIIRTGEELQNSASVGQIPHVTTPADDEMVEP